MFVYTIYTVGVISQYKLYTGQRPLPKAVSTESHAIFRSSSRGTLSPCTKSNAHVAPRIIESKDTCLVVRYRDDVLLGVVSCVNSHACVGAKQGIRRPACLSLRANARERFRRFCECEATRDHPSIPPMSQRSKIFSPTVMFPCRRLHVLDLLHWVGAGGGVAQGWCMSWRSDARSPRSCAHCPPTARPSPPGSRGCTLETRAGTASRATTSPQVRAPPSRSRPPPWLREPRGERLELIDGISVAAAAEYTSR